MNERIQAILLKIIIELKKDKWTVGPDWEITLKGEGHVPLSKNIKVQGNLDAEEWNDVVETTIDLKLISEDELTYFPEYIIYANIYIKGGDSKDIAYKLDADVAFTDRDVRDESKISLAAKKISRLVEDHIESEYSDYIDQNGENIRNYNQGGGPDPDYDPER